MIWDDLDERHWIEHVLIHSGKPRVHDSWIKLPTLRCAVTSLAVAQRFMRLATEKQLHLDQVIGPAVDALVDMVRYAYPDEAKTYGERLPRESFWLTPLENSLYWVIRFSECRQDEWFKTLVFNALCYARRLYDSLDCDPSKLGDFLSPEEIEDLCAWQMRLAKVISEVVQGDAPEHWREMLDSFRIVGQP